MHWLRGTATLNAADSTYVVPSGAVHLVPWGALDITKPVMVLPTGSWLVQQGSGDNRLARTDRAIVIGDPEFRGTLPQLPGALREARAVSAFYGTQPLVGVNATKAKLRSSVGRGVEILHLATHAEFDTQFPLQSRLHLSGPDGYESLTAQELFQRPLSAQVVILSACDTGVGQVDVGDDFLGLPRSFYLGGATTVISSLWPVDDAGTALFMTTFHKKVAMGDDYGKAWLLARDAVKNAGMAPWIYGAFVIGGKRG